MPKPTAAELDALLDFAEQTFADWSSGTWTPGEARPTIPGSYSVPSDLSVDDPCPSCKGSGRCPDGCQPLDDQDPDFEGGSIPVRTSKQVKVEDPEIDGGWRYAMVIDRGTDCDLCTVYGDCMNCAGSGIGRRPFQRTASQMILTRSLRYPLADRSDAEVVRLSLDRAATLLAERTIEPAQLALDLA